MNDTAKKLREAAGCEYASVWNMISALRGRMGIEERDTYNNDLSAILTAIADELDELEAKAPTEKEHRILDMWPRFEDGEPVMIGDGVDGLGGEIIEVYIAENAAAIWNNYGNHMHLSLGERVNRPAPKVLDADGVEIKADDTVWHEDGSELHVIGFGDVQDGETMLVVKYAAGPTKWGEVRCLSVTHTRPAPKVLDADGVEIEVGDTVWWQHDPTEYTVKGVSEGVVHLTYLGSIGTENTTVTFTHYLTHTRPGSWERLEEDALKGVCEYAEAERKPGTIDAHTCCGCRFDEDGDGLTCEQQMALDIIRRAKALAGAEAGR